jgi:hypothetical protein
VKGGGPDARSREFDELGRLRRMVRGDRHLLVLLTWVVTDLLKINRGPYIGVLAVVTGGLSYGYLAWSGTDAAGFIRDHWVWGLAGAAVIAGLNLQIVRVMVRRGELHAPRRAPLHGADRAVQVLWEDVVYGAAEGMLLSVLPLLVLWQACDQLGWTTGWTGTVGSGALAFGGSLVVIACTTWATGSTGASG